jgi:hypothetical protein
MRQVGFLCERPAWLFAAVLGFLWLTTGWAAQDAPPDKSGYTLFRPTPPELMREMSTDRPDKTESSHTVDAGHFQVEMDLVSYTHDHDTHGGADVKTESFSIAPFNLKVGLFNNLDLQLMFDSFTKVRVKDKVAGTTETESGFGNLATRVKLNLWGNDGGMTSLAMMPYLSFPTHQHDLAPDGLEGGVIFPIGIELPRGWSVCPMAEFDCIRNSSSDGSHFEFIGTVTVGHKIYGALDGYIEFFGLVSTERDARWVGTVDIGFTYGLTENIQLDGGVNIGVTRSADDVNPFLGLSMRF